MLYEMFLIMKWMPKVTLFYVLFSLINGLGINYIILVLTIFFDMLDYIPMD